MTDGVFAGLSVRRWDWYVTCDSKEHRWYARARASLLRGTTGRRSQGDDGVRDVSRSSVGGATVISRAGDTAYFRVTPLPVCWEQPIAVARRLDWTQQQWRREQERVDPMEAAAFSSSS